MPTSSSSGKNRNASDTRNRRQIRAEEAARKQRQKRLMVLLAVVLVVAVAGATIFAIVTSQKDGTPNLDAPMALDTIPQSGMTIGNADAPVTVIEYADFQCPFCANFALNLEPKIIQDYVATGKVRFEFQPMPILSRKALDDPTNESVRSAEAAMCAADQGKFWDFYHLLYTKQTGENVGDFTDAKLNAYAKEAGLDTTAFSTCLTNRTHLPDVQASLKQGQDAGVQGTPTFFVNGTKVLGSGGLEQAIKDAIDAAP